MSILGLDLFRGIRHRLFAMYKKSLDKNLRPLGLVSRAIQTWRAESRLGVLVKTLNNMARQNKNGPNTRKIHELQRYDDLLDPTQDKDVDMALRRIPKEDLMARNARLRRAINLMMKKEELPDDMQVQCQLFAF